MELDTERWELIVSVLVCVCSHPWSVSRDPSARGTSTPSSHRRPASAPQAQRGPQRAAGARQAWRWACAWCAAWTGSGWTRMKERGTWARWWRSAGRAAPLRPTKLWWCSGTAGRAPTTAPDTRAPTTCCCTTTHRSVRPNTSSSSSRAEHCNSCRSSYSAGQNHYNTSIFSS